MKKRKTGDGLEDLYVTKWKHYKQLEFLENFVTPKASQSNLQVILSNNVILPWYTSSHGCKYFAKYSCTSLALSGFLLLPSH